MKLSIIMIKVIIGLGNPGPRFASTRHNIGFVVLDALATEEHLSWKQKDNFLYTEWNDTLLIKPQTFMNESGKVIPFLLKKGIKPEEMLVVHDELELPYGTVKHRQDGSHRGHNGLRSIIAACGANFHRIRVGIGRPEQKEDVPDYVLAPFSHSEVAQQPSIINQALIIIQKLREDHP